MSVPASVEVGSVLGEKEDREKGDHICFPGCIKNAEFSSSGIQGVSTST